MRSHSFMLAGLSIRSVVGATSLLAVLVGGCGSGNNGNGDAAHDGTVGDTTGTADGGDSHVGNDTGMPTDTGVHPDGDTGAPIDTGPTDTGPTDTGPTDTGPTDTSMPPDTGGPGCGDGILQAPEQCDFGTADNTQGSGCEPNCHFSCALGGTTCDDGQACNGTETCAANTGPNNTPGQHCVAGTPLAQGASCGTNLFCVNSNCVAPSCGDMVIETGEECDDGNAVNGDGCDACRFSCLTTDPLRNCPSGNACVAAGTCNNATHTCTAGAPLGNGTACGSGVICVNGACVAVVCGDGFVSTGEQCDFGTAGNVHDSGCEPTCVFSCTTAPNSCDDANPCNGAETCSAIAGPNGTNGQHCVAGTPLANGANCGGNNTCRNGVCTPPMCGNGTIEPGEACDLGALNGTGQGCTSMCQLDCTTNANCDDGNVCNGAETCVAATVNGQSVRHCQAGTAAARCTVCTNGLCNAAGMCVASTCGDSCVDAARGEQCDPPNGTSCSPMCTRLAVCGNGMLEAGEQCDDGNRFNLDGCDSACKYEVITRMTSISIVGGTAPAACMPTTNRFGAQVFTATALGQLNPLLQTDIDSGATDILTPFLNLDDPTGVADASLQLGVVNAALDPARGAFPTGNPIDWWFIASGASLTNGAPTNQLNASLAGRNLIAGPGTVSVSLSLGGAPIALQMNSSHVVAAVNAMPVPNVPAPPPATLAAGLTVFQTLSGSGTGQGLCGNITVASLAQIPVPQQLAQGGSTACGMCAGTSRQYTYCGANMPVGPTCNSLLDLVVGGCRVVACIVTVSNPLQPDVPAMSGGTVRPLVPGALNKIPTAQTAGNNDGYSSYLHFNANRAHITHQTCTLTTDCQTGRTCTAGICM